LDGKGWFTASDGRFYAPKRKRPQGLGLAGAEGRASALIKR